MSDTPDGIIRDAAGAPIGRLRDNQIDGDWHMYPVPLTNWKGEPIMEPVPVIGEDGYPILDENERAVMTERQVTEMRPLTDPAVVELLAAEGLVVDGTSIVAADAEAPAES